MNKKDPVDVLREEIMAHPNLEQFFTEKVGMSLRQYMTGYVIDNTSVEELVDELDLQHSRCCSECGKPMYEGFYENCDFISGDTIEPCSYLVNKAWYGKLINGELQKVAEYQAA